MKSSAPPVLSAEHETTGRWVALSLALLICGASASIYVRSALGPLQEAIAQSLALSDYQISLVQGPALAAPMLLFAIPLGFLVDRWSRAKLLVALTLIGVIATVVTALATSFPALLLARIVAGVVAPGTAIAAASFAADIFPAGQRGRANMAIAFGQVAGMSAAFAIGGTLLVALGEGSDGWRTALLWMAAPVAFVAATMLFLREPPRTGMAATNVSSRQAFAIVGKAWRLVLPLTAGVGIVAIADGAALIWGVPTFIRRFGMPADQAGSWLAAIILISGIAGPLAGGMLTDWSQRTGGSKRAVSLLILLAAVAVPTGLFAVVPAPALAATLMCIFLIVGAAINVSVTALFTIVLPNEVRGLCMSAVWTVGAIFGLGLAPVAVSLLSTSSYVPGGIPPALAMVCVGSSVLGVIIFAFGRSGFDRLALAGIAGAPAASVSDLIPEGR